MFKELIKKLTKNEKKEIIPKFDYIDLHKQNMKIKETADLDFGQGLKSEFAITRIGMHLPEKDIDFFALCHDTKIPHEKILQIIKDLSPPEYVDVDQFYNTLLSIYKEKINGKKINFFILIDKNLPTKIKNTLGDIYCRANLDENDLFSKNMDDFELITAEIEHKELLIFTIGCQLHFKNQNIQKPQYEAEIILNNVDKFRKSFDIDYIQVIIDVDGTGHERNELYSLGLSVVNGHSSIVFSKRLDLEFWRNAYNEHSFLLNTLHVSNHECGHCFGLDHKYINTSVMFPGSKFLSESDCNYGFNDKELKEIQERISMIKEQICNRNN